MDKSYLLSNNPARQQNRYTSVPIEKKSYWVCLTGGISKNKNIKQLNFFSLYLSIHVQKVTHHIGTQSLSVKIYNCD
jgi:hypothetical protein